MYNPSEIENFEMLSSYLRSTPENLSKFVHGARYVIDFSDLGSLNAIPKFSEDQNRTDFQRFYIPKKNKKLGYRIIYKSFQQFTKDILKVLNFNLKLIYTPNEYVHGFINGRNTRSNASAHLGNQFLLKLDIKNFFESIEIDSVEEAFLSLGFMESIAADLAKICTLDDKVVQGFPTSPVVANIVCDAMDIEIQKLCSHYDAAYTRYADDISISGNGILPPVHEISSILNNYNFKLNTKKTQRFKRGQNLYVTGLSISDQSYPRIPKAVKKRIRQYLYYIKKFGFHSHICRLNGFSEDIEKSSTNSLISHLENYLEGWINYMKPIEPDLAESFRLQLNEIKEIHYADLRKMLKQSNGVFNIRL
jgi:RNA-directed DNA polymerase